MTHNLYGFIDMIRWLDEILFRRKKAMMNGTNALMKTVWLWVDVFMHAMAIGIAKMIAMMILLNDNWIALARWISLKKTSFFSSSSFLGKLYWWLSMSKLFLHWNNSLSRCHDSISTRNNHVANSQCRPDIEHHHFPQCAHDRWLRWSVEFLLHLS